jgi:hypothetical protein
MPETLQKLQPDRDLQCYFFEPSAVAALNATSASGYTVSGTWRQQFDWAVIEWNCDNVFEHPAFRYLPDGDLSGLTLSYQETRTNCIPLDSVLYPTVDWPSLRIWAYNGTSEQIYFIPLANYATAVAGSYVSASVQFTLSGTVTTSDYVGVAFLGEHYPYLMNSGDTLETAIQYIALEINNASPTMTATSSGTTITITGRGTGSTLGSNGNRIGAYAYVSGSQTEQWDATSKMFSGGTSPTLWQITLPFASLVDPNPTPPQTGNVPASAIRKMRWTYAADLQASAFVRSEFQVVVSNWTVTGSGQAYSVAGPGSQRIEDDSFLVQYANPPGWPGTNPPAWASGAGNFSGGTIHYASSTGASLTCTYSSAQDHSLYLGTRLVDAGTQTAQVSVSVDGGSPVTVNLNLGEDVLIRTLLGVLSSGTHTVTATHDGDNGTYFYFDFLEIAIPTTTLPAETTELKLTAATDWDTLHSQALAPERTAWMIYSLGFQARVNYYVGALWFYELNNVGQQYASATVTFSGIPDPNLITQIILNRTGEPDSDENTIEHLNLIGDTTETLTIAFALLLNSGYTSVWAQATGSQLTIYSRSMGTDGNAITIATSPNTTNLTITLSGTNTISGVTTFSGGVDGNWYTDLEVVPRINRAVRDWSQSFFQALHGYGFDATASFSMELGNGDPSVDAGIAQRYPDQTAVLLNTPSLQTNFSPTSAAFWQQVHLDMATVMTAAGLTPYLQFGEVQWWYFPEMSSPPPPAVPAPIGMPFYDAYTTSTFEAQYGRAMTVINSNTLDPTTVPDEAAFLPGLIGSFTAQIRAFVRATHPTCRFEVLYPPDVNDFPLTQVINYPTNDWTPANLTCLKTESFSFTYDRNLDLSLYSMNFVNSLGFTPAQRSHLVGVSDSTTAWLKEVRMAEGLGFESVVLFALDQMCLIGYPLPLSRGMRRSVQLG